jgi:clan AA aspartic protease (TIGR02281 family)
MKFSLVGSDKPIIIVKTKVNGKGPFNFAVDTGASVTALSKQLAQSLEISENKGNLKKGHSCCGEIDAAMASIKSVEVGDTEVRDIQVALMDLTSFSKMLKIDLAGIIGYSFMKNYKVSIDYPNTQIFFQKPQ